MKLGIYVCIYTHILKLFTCTCVNGKTSLFVSLSQSHEAVVKLGACTGQQKGSCQNRERWSGSFHSGFLLLRNLPLQRLAYQEEIYTCKRQEALKDPQLHLRVLTHLLQCCCRRSSVSTAVSAWPLCTSWDDSLSAQVWQVPR